MRYSTDAFHKNIKHFESMIDRYMYKVIELAKQKSFYLNEHLDEYSSSDLTDVLEMNIMLYELIKIKESRN